MEDNKLCIRRIIYVDASFNNIDSEAKISLYDKEINKLDTLLITNISNSNEAEKYAILNACIYIKKKNIENRKIHILNDNLTATKDKKILKICQYFEVNISWIPREINEIADKGSKLDINIKEEESNNLKLFYDILIKSTLIEINIPLNNNIDKEDGDKRKNILKNAIRNCLSLQDKSYISIGEVGKYLKEHNPTFEYTQLKKEFLNYSNDFIIVNDNFVRLKE